jgi:hypothetical protein
MIRHQNGFGGLRTLLAALTVESLPVPMIKPAFNATLMTAIRLTPLLASGFVCAPVAAIRLAAVAVATDEKHRTATTGSAKPLSQHHIAGIGHLRPMELDSRRLMWQDNNALGTLLRSRGC